MSPTADTDRADAVRAVAWYLAQRDRTPSAERPDPDVAAAEIVQALYARGWRRTAAQPAPPWMPTRQQGERAAPDTVRQHAARARANLARPTEETQTDG
ncbi:hypothetical protein [Nocardiopsis sp. FR26]|uniref:hypothetical protein n=1 Tax=Nocardiopsis sp. FR26 TaxID=2605987 RepID=UPI001356E78F|nr:hypothetical protein [Nocardiopsis sp. FR26]